MDYDKSLTDRQLHFGMMDDDDFDHMNIHENSHGIVCNKYIISTLNKIMISQRQ